LPSLSLQPPATLTALRLIARLKLQLTLRHYKKQLVNAAGVIALLLAMLLLALFGGGALIVYAHSADPAARGRLMAWAFWILALVWINAPLAQFDSARNLDLNGLRLLPLSTRSFTLAVILDALLSPQGLILLPWLFILVAAFSSSLAQLPLTLLVVLLLAACTVSLGQAVFLWANRLLASRRFTDASIAVSMVIFLLIQGLNLLLQARMVDHLPDWLPALLEALRATFVPLTRWLFPGLAATALEQAQAGQIGAFLLAQILLIAACVLCILAAGLAARQFYLGEIESGGSAPAKRLPSARLRSSAAPLSGLLSSALGALYQRERLYLTRDPLLKMLFIQTLVMAVYLSGMLVFMGSRFSELAAPAGAPPGPVPFPSHWLLFALALLLGLMESSVLFNKLGYEGSFATILLLSPVDRRQLLRSKSLFLISHFGGVNLLLIAAAGVVLRVPAPQALAAVLLVLSNTIVADAAGNFVSVYFPFTYRRIGRRLRMVPAQAGCGFMFIYGLVSQLCNICVLPGSAALILGSVYYGWGGLLLGAALAGGLAWLAHSFGLTRAARVLQEREPELLLALARTGE